MRLEQEGQIDSVREHFDVNSQSWKDLYAKFGQVHDLVLFNRKEFSVDFVSKYLEPGSRILDAGCGAGVVAMDVVRRGYFVHGVDVSQRMIDLCNEGFTQSGIEEESYSFTVGDVVDMPTPAGSFDGAIALGFLEYQEDEIKALQSIRDALRPGGILICTGPSKITVSNGFGIKRLFLRGYSAVSGWKEVSINRYSLPRFRRLMNASGFTIVDYKRHGYCRFIGLRKIFRAELFLHNTLTRFSRRIPIDGFADDIIVVARKND